MRTATRMSVRTLGVLLVGSWVSAGAWAATPCSADTGVIMPCAFGITDTGIQISTGAIKFQARVAQAKMPIPEGVLLRVSVNLTDAAGIVKCTQNFNDVKVMNSILNLDFQPPNCVLDDVVATTPDLRFQLVLSGTPVKSIPIGTVPYALKANRAVKAQEAHLADIAAQAHYAHRITADRQTLNAKAIGTGYFDFYTPPTGGSLYPGENYTPYVKDGFMQWTPVNSTPVLHLAAKGVNDDQMAMLDGLFLESRNTTAHGTVVIAPAGAGGVAFTVQSRGIDVTGEATMRNHATVSEGLSVTRGATISEGATILGGAYISNGAFVGGGASIDGGVFVAGGATIQDGLTASGESHLNGGAWVNGGLVVIEGGADVTGTTTLKGGVTVTGGGAKLEGGVSVTGNASFANGAVIDKGLTVSSGALSITDLTEANGGAKISGGATILGPATFGVSNATNADTVEFFSPVKFHAGMTLDTAPPQEAWQTVSVGWLAGWGQASTSGSAATWATAYGPVAYMKDSVGFVHVRGLAVTQNAGGSAVTHGLPMFTLPVGYRPKFVQSYIARDGGYGYTHRIAVSPDGTVSCDTCATAASAYTVDLSPVVFDPR